ncbi:hypothetical protein HN51_022043, partial [Arachis hypogaea]
MLLRGGEPGEAPRCCAMVKQERLAGGELWFEEIRDREEEKERRGSRLIWKGERQRLQRRDGETAAAGWRLPFPFYCHHHQ